MKMNTIPSIGKFGFFAVASMAAFACEAGTLTVKFGTEMDVEIEGEIRRFAKNDTFVPTAIPCIYKMRPVLAEGERVFTIYGNDNIKGERNCRFPLLGEGNWVRVALDPYPVEDKTVELSAIKATGVFYVDATNGNDEWDGTADYENRNEELKKGPKKSLQAANDAATGDYPIVLAAPGTYNTGCATNVIEDVKTARRLISDKNIGFISMLGADETFIIGNSSESEPINGVYMAPPNGGTAFIQGFTITECLSSIEGDDDGGGFVSTAHRAYCLDSVISNNYAKFYGATRYGVFKRTKIYNNKSYRKMTRFGVFVSCIFAQNRITNGNDTDARRAFHDAAEVYFCTYDLRHTDAADGRKLLFKTDSELHASLVFGLTDKETIVEDLWNDSKALEDPYFNNANLYDYRLGPLSLAQNASSYSNDLDGKSRSLMTSDADGRMPVLTEGNISIGALWPDKVWYVDGVNGDDENSGKLGFPKKTIRAAIESAVSGGVIYVAPGTYADEEGSQAVDGKVESRVVVPNYVTLVGTAGAENTFIVGAEATGDQIDNEVYGTGTNAVRCVYAKQGAVLRGFTLTGGRAIGTGDENQPDCQGAAFLSAERLGATIEDCIVSNNAGYAGTIYGAIVRKCRAFGNFGVRDNGSGAAGSYCSWHDSIIDKNRGDGIVSNSEIIKGCTICSDNKKLNGETAQVLYWYTTEDRAIVNTAVFSTKYYFGNGGRLFSTNCYLTYSTYFSRVFPDSAPERLYNTIVGKSDAYAQIDAEYRPLLGAVSLIDNGDAAYATENVDNKDVLGNPRIMNGKLDIGAVEYDWRPAFSAELGKRFTITHVSSSVTTNETGGLVISDGSVTGTVREKGPYKVQIDLAGGTAKIYAGEELVGECSGVGSHAVRFPVDDPTLPVRIVSVPGESDPAFAVLKSLAYAKGFVLGIR